MRDLYKCAGEFLLTNEIDLHKRKITAEHIVNYSEVLKPEDIIVRDYYLNYGSKDKNPVDNVYFYNSSSTRKL